MSEASGMGVHDCNLNTYKAEASTGYTDKVTLHYIARQSQNNRNLVDK